MAFLVAIAADEVVVDDADGLQEGVDDGGADEGEAAFFEVARNFYRERREGGDLGKVAKFILKRTIFHEAPQMLSGANSRVLHGEPRLGIFAESVDFESIADDSFVVAQRFQLVIGHGGDGMHVEVVK